MKIRIVTDSMCDVPPEAADELCITVIPDYINAGGRSYLDGVELTRRSFYEQLPGWKIPPTTATPSVEVFQAAYEKLALEGAEAVISLHASERISNLVNVARMAARATQSVPVTVVPGGFLSLGGGFVTMGAARAARDGAGLGEVLKVVEDMLLRTYTFAGLDTLEFLRRSGRLPHLAARLGGWLQVLPVLKVHQDEIDMDLARTRTRAVQRVSHLVESLGPLEELGVVHANAPERAHELIQQIPHLFPPGRRIWVMDVTPILGVHLGPGGLGLAAVQAKK